ncbi:MAG: hemerythrin domain-containing protein [Chloroflexi bacterium]|nr:hemerythrin domain-containing protein [Chloroflexota bacterium]
MQAVDILRAEHDGTLHVLTFLEQAAAAAAAGQPIPQNIFTDIQEFITIFVDRCHHGKEENIVFSRLAEHTAAPVLQELVSEHTQNHAYAVAFVSAVQAYVPGDSATGAALATAAHRYAELLRRHIERETSQLFPLMQQALSEDDSQLTALFDRFEEEQIGHGTHERLHQMIEAFPGRLAPWAPTPPPKP